MTENQKSLDSLLEGAVSRALRDNLAPLQRTADELHQAYADLVAACASSRPSNALPAMLRAQAAAASLSAGLAVLSNFVAVALHPRDQHRALEDRLREAVASVRSQAVSEDVNVKDLPVSASVSTVDEQSAGEVVEQSPETIPALESSHVAQEDAASEEEPVVAEDLAHADAPAAPVFDVTVLSSELQDLHRRANRVAKVTMQDIQLLRPADVRLGRENKDLCDRLRNDLDKARREYDRRFHAILDHPVDYFHSWMVEILAEGDEKILGEYPYPSPVLRH